MKEYRTTMVQDRDLSHNLFSVKEACHGLPVRIYKIASNVLGNFSPRGKTNSGTNCGNVRDDILILI